MIYQVNGPKKKISGIIELTGSKSISNRALIIRALSDQDFDIQRLAEANDTELLEQLLSSYSIVRDAGPAGTTFRFMTAYLALQPGQQVLTGSERMKKRPIGVLVEALRNLGADIEYLEEEGYPPLKIGESNVLGSFQPLEIAANTSSQYISALLMIAPVLPTGLKLRLKGKVVSRPYIEMTLAQMAYFGIKYEWEGETITILPQDYIGKTYKVEADWSAASYYYAIAAIADEVDLQLNGLFDQSIQGDAVLSKMMESFGVKSTFTDTGVHLSKSGQSISSFFEWDFLKCPDLAQTIAVVCGVLGVKGRFTGLETLRIKETDRIAALQTEMGKIGVKMEEETPGYFLVSGKAAIPESTMPVFSTYEDHRMAMAFAPVGMLGRIGVAEPHVVNKSYPAFWDDLSRIGFEIIK